MVAFVMFLFFGRPLSTPKKHTPKRHCLSWYGGLPPIHVVVFAWPFHIYHCVTGADLKLDAALRAIAHNITSFPLAA